MSQNTKTILTIIGFAFAGIGFLSLCLSFVGLDFTFMHWLRSMGNGIAFLSKAFMMVAGFMLIYFGQVDLDKEEI